MVELMEGTAKVEQGACPNEMELMEVETQVEPKTWGDTDGLGGLGVIPGLWN